MVKFIELLEARMKIRYPKISTEVGYLESAFLKNPPAFLIIPGSCDRDINSISTSRSRINIEINYFDLDIPGRSLENVKFIEEFVNFIEKDEELMKQYIKIGTNFTTAVDGEEENVNKTFVGSVRVILQLRR